MLSSHKEKPPYLYPPEGTQLSVTVYRNLHKACWSVKDRYTGKVIALLEEVLLSGGVTFHVSAAGRERVLAQRVKNVHAGVRGRWKTEKSPPPFTLHNPRRVRYNPYTHPYFTDEDLSPVSSAHSVHLRRDGSVWATGIPHTSNDAY
jgi:hypothetical protein